MPGLLEILPEYVLHWIVKRGNERRLHEKEALLTEGKKNESLFIVLDGLFCSYAAGSPRVLEHFGAGSVKLGNFHPRNRAKEFMDYVLEWNLIHRTEADMNRLFERSMFGKPCSKIQFEALGINLFAECSRD